VPKLFRFVLLILVCNGCFIWSYPQSNHADSAFLTLSVSNAVSVQSQQLGENLRLYNGSAYTYSYSGTKGHPFFRLDSMLPGDLLYDEAYYSSVPMFYDLVIGEVIISSFARDHNIMLVGDKISQFDLLGHHFVRLQKDSTHGATIQTGFYDQVYSNQTVVYVKREKKLKEVAKAEGIDARFIDFNYYFIKRNNLFYSISNSGALLDVFADRKNELKKYLRKNHYNFKRQPEITLIKAAEYYDRQTSH
jgi:hypothetical protein